MKHLSFLTALIILISYFASGQNRTEGTGESQPIIFKIKSHEPNFKGFKNKYLRQVYSSGKSFYKQKDQWRQIIDSIWGPGLPTTQKLQIFDDYANHIHDEFDGFQSLGMNWASWDSLRNYWRAEITDSTSRGVFSGIMTRFAFSLHDAHTYAWDDTVTQTSLNSGVPVLIMSGFVQNFEHFGAVITAMPDSNLLVLRVAQGHPLNLQPGDIILGYEGVRWKDLVEELMRAELPIYGPTIGAVSARNDERLICAGMNWHLFDTMDVVQHSTGDTLHLSVAPIQGFTTASMINNEQVAIPGIPFPNFFQYQDVSFGTLSGTNIGYIYLFVESWWRMGGGWLPPWADEELSQAVNALKGKDALIIDLRYNQGGLAFFDDAFRILFNRLTHTIGDVYRCNGSNPTLCPGSPPNYTDHGSFDIPGQPPGFDRPIAMLVGPTCVSMGDMTAYRLHSHDMVRSFGKSSSASLGWNTFITSYPGWTIRYSLVDAFLLSDPSTYLNRKEFPIDYPVWFNPTDVANGIDPVVQKAIQWIDSASFAHNIIINKLHLQPSENDTLIMTANVTNPNSHPLTVKAFYRTGEIVIDSSVFTDDGLHHDGASGDGIWGTSWLPPAAEEFYKANVSTIDRVDGSPFTLKEVALFTTAGPVTLDSTVLSKAGNTLYTFKPYFKNNGITDTITTASVSLSSQKPGVSSLTPNQFSLPDIRPQSVVSNYTVIVKADTGTFTGEFNFTFDIQHDQFTYWRDSIHIVAGNIHLLSPNSGEVWEGRTNDTITWTSNGVSNVRIEMSTDNGGTWPVIITGSTPAAAGAYVFKVPDHPSGQCRIRVRDVTFRLLSDISDTTFTITPSPIVIATVAGVWGWNLLSLPLRLEDFRVDSIYPTRVMPVYEYTDHYCQCDTLECGRGYWVRLSAPQTLSHTGRFLDSNAVDVKAGWNMIGSISSPVATVNITSNPGGIVTSQFFDYDEGYSHSDSIHPGKGYWVNVNQDGKLILTSSTREFVASNRIRIIPTEEQPPTAPDGKEPASILPKTYALGQNYPNPFNPSTEVKYQMPEAGWVTLKVFDVLGREVATLVNEGKQPGEYTVQWDAGSLSSGVYVYRLSASSSDKPSKSFVQVRKMLLVR